MVAPIERNMRGLQEDVDSDKKSPRADLKLVSRNTNEDIAINQVREISKEVAEAVKDAEANDPGIFGNSYIEKKDSLEIEDKNDQVRNEFADEVAAGEYEVQKVKNRIENLGKDTNEDIPVMKNLTDNSEEVSSSFSLEQKIKPEQQEKVIENLNSVRNTELTGDIKYSFGTRVKNVLKKGFDAVWHGGEFNKSSDIFINKSKARMNRFAKGEAIDVNEIYYQKLAKEMFPDFRDEDYKRFSNQVRVKLETKKADGKKVSSGELNKLLKQYFK